MNSIKTLAALASAMALGTISCNLVERPAAESEKPTNELSIAARQPIGSTQPVTMISTLAQLRAMNTTGNYKLANNINASATATTPFVPIGAIKAPFTGTFDGGNFIISNLTITGGAQTGMFSWAVNADFKNIRMTNVNVTGGLNTGALAGNVQNVDLRNSYFTGTVTGNVQGDSRVGMVFGSAGSYVRIYRSYATGTVQGSAKYAGGFIGHAYSTGTHDPNDDFRVIVNEVFTNVTVNPNTSPAIGAVYAGGVIGYLVGGDIQNVSSVGSVTGRFAAGGLLGYVDNGNPNSKASILRAAISRGIVTDAAAANRAGTIGTSSGTFAWCSSFWDNQADGGVPNPSMPEPWCQTGKTSNELKAPTLTAPKLLNPYIFGMLVTQAMVNSGAWPACKLGSGSDGDWGFGTCNTTVLWAPNSSTEYNTLTRIPNPGVQPR